MANPTKTKEVKAQATETKEPVAKSVFDMSISELQAAAEDTKKEVLAIIQRNLPGLVRLTKAERQSSDGKLRQDEDDALLGVANAAILKPGLFAAWTGKGNDPATLADHLQRHVLLGDIVTAIAGDTSPIADTRLQLAGGARSALLDAYDIAKPNAPHDDDVKGAIAKTIDFYSAPAQKAAKTRKKNKEAAEQQKADEAAGKNDNGDGSASKAA